MTDLKKSWQEYIFKALKTAADRENVEAGIDSAENIIVSSPPKPEMGDFAFAMFPFAKALRTSPQNIAGMVVKELENMEDASAAGTFSTAGPYVNVKINIMDSAAGIISKVLNDKDDYGRGSSLKGRKIMLEFSCPNTNKPLHLGHLRNDSIGSAVARILKAAGAEVMKVNLINDRGIHICKSMLAYRKFGNGATPESTGMKSDHFVGKYYVKFDSWSKEDDGALAEAQKMLQDWESGDEEVTSLWKQMNKWTIDGIEETYKATGISFDKVYYESNTYSSGKQEVLNGLEKGVFYKEDDGSIWADLSEIKLDKKVLLRGDGTTLYMTQDLGTAIARQSDWPFDQLIYVVGSEQQYHFQVLFHILKKLGYIWAEDLKHLSYGMVNLPDGKMKSREGTVVDADDLVKQLGEMAKEEIIAKERGDDVGDIDGTAHSIALGALNYYLLQVSPSKDMIFNPAESLSFNGNTGPYLQYMGARISSMIRKFENQKEKFAGIEASSSVLTVEEEKELIKLLISYPEVVEQTANQYNPSALTAFLYELAKTYSRFYHDNPVLNNEDKVIAVSRMELSKAVLQVFRNGFELIGIPFLEKM
ncbi:MAG: arginine--tRNA ligase [Spirochaetales bacterium]|nr:arginine--tRNA ligase [Spirochaetales bacterium]